MMCHAGFGGVDAGDARVLLLPRDVRRRLRRPLRERRPRRGADARPEHRERAGRGDRAELPGARRAALARRGLGRAGPLPRRPRAAQGLPLRPPDDVHRPRRPHASRGPAGAFGGGPAAAAPSTSSSAAASETAARAPRQRSSSRPATSSATAPAAAAATARRRSATASSCARDVREGKVSAPRARPREVVRVAGVDPDHLRGDPQRAPRHHRRDGARRSSAAPTRRTSRRAPTSRARSSTRSCARSRRPSPSPSHLGSMVEQVPQAIRSYGAERLAAGRRASSPTTRTRAAST